MLSYTTQQLLFEVALFGCVALLIYIVILKLVHYQRVKRVNNALSKSGHIFEATSVCAVSHVCAACEARSTVGFQCLYCTTFVDQVSCAGVISQKFPCKVNVARSDDEKTKHHWISNNFPSNAICAVCKQTCDEQEFEAWCSWCRCGIHSFCKRKFEEICDFGDLKMSILPPHSVLMRKAGNRGQKQMVIDSIERPKFPFGWRPIFVIVNPMSGSGSGIKVAHLFQEYLHPVQIIDVTKSNMKAVLRWLDENPEIESRFVIAGGDGTISLVLNDIDNLKNRPAVGVLPLGTGNDLSRVLGWGKHSDGDVEPCQILNDLQHAEPFLLDRWSVTIEHPRKLGVLKTQSTKTMTNYISIGVDACVTYGMQSTRDQLPRAMSSRLLNKFLFFTFGTKDVFERACSGLQENIRLIADGKEIELPEMEGLVFLNIPSWGAGVEPWNMDNDTTMPQSCSDKMFEIFAVRSSFHIAQLQVGLSAPLRIAQCHEAQLFVTRGPLPMQCDGEAWLQNRGTISVFYKGASLMLKKKNSSSPKSGFFL